MGRKAEGKLYLRHTGSISSPARSTEPGLWGGLDLGSIQKLVILPLVTLIEESNLSVPRFAHLEKWDYYVYSARQ